MNRSCLIIEFAIVVGVAFMAGATNRTWTGGAGNGNFLDAANWNPSGTPAAGDYLFFDFGVTGLAGSGSATEMRFNSGTFDFTGDMAISSGIVIPCSCTTPARSRRQTSRTSHAR